MKYAVVKIGGNQYKVTEGEQIEIEKINSPAEKVIDINQVLLLVDGDNLKIGNPFLSGVTVKATVVRQFKGKKIRAATYKAKARYRRVKGFRKQLTMIKIQKIENKEKKKSSSAKS